MIIGLDVDGVLVDFNRGWRRHYNEWFNAQVDENAVPDTWMGKDDILGSSHFETEEEFWAWTDSVPGFWRDMPAVPGAMGGVYQLLETGHELKIITSRHVKTRIHTGDWFYAHWPQTKAIRVPQIHHTHKLTKHHVPVQLYVDDNPDSIASLAQHGMPVVRFAYPYNEKSAANRGTAKNWGELVALVNKLTKATP